MQKFESRIEVPVQRDPEYDTIVMSSDDVARGRHRNFVGGMWDEIGRHQLDFLVQRGLRPEMHFLDVGCGALRAGIHLVGYLDPGHYYGFDINPSLIEAGWNAELSDDLREKLPPSNLHSTDRFDANFGVLFDMAIANSIFTHVSLNHVRLCLHRLASVMKPGGRFYATFFEQGDDAPVDGVFGSSRKKQYTERNVYWYYRDDMSWAAERTPFEAHYIGGWDHPRNQKMMEFVRT
jgi:SAM-dependent methyltransferase